MDLIISPPQQPIAEINPTQNQQSPTTINDTQKTQQLRSKSCPQTWVAKLKAIHNNANPPSSLPLETLPQPAQLRSACDNLKGERDIERVG